MNTGVLMLVAIIAGIAFECLSIAERREKFFSLHDMAFLTMVLIATWGAVTNL